MNIILFYDVNLNTQDFVYLEFVKYQPGLHGNLSVPEKCNVYISALQLLQSILEGSNIFETMEIGSRHGFVCVDVLRPSQPNGVMSSAVSLPNHTFTGQA